MCLLFDRTRSLSLHLFEHVHGESRDRGQAMVDLLALYEKNGLAGHGVRTAGLPAAVPGIPLHPAAAAACELLGQPAHILEAHRRAAAQARIGLRSGVSRAGRARRGQARRSRTLPHCCRGRTPIRTISPRSMPPGRTRRYGSARRGTAARTADRPGSQAGVPRPGCATAARAVQPRPADTSREIARCARPSITSCSAGTPISASPCSCSAACCASIASNTPGRPARASCCAAVN